MLSIEVFNRSCGPSCEQNLLTKVANKSYYKKKSTQAAKRVVKKVFNKIFKKRLVANKRCKQKNLTTAVTKMID